MDIRQKIAQMDGRFFSVRFIKRTTGQPRNMVCRRSKTVVVGKTGEGLKFSPSAHNLETVLDIDVLKANLADGRQPDDAAKASYRHIPLEAVTHINGIPVENLT